MKNIYKKIKQIKSKPRDVNGQPLHSFYGLIYQGPVGVKPVVNIKVQRKNFRQIF